MNLGLERRKYIVIALFALFWVIVGMLLFKGLSADTESLQCSSPAVQVGKSLTIKWAGSPRRVSKSKVKWSLSNKTRVSMEVSKSRKSIKLKGKKEGSVTVSLKYKNRRVGKLKVYVVGDSLSASSASIQYRKSKTFKLQSYVKALKNMVSWEVSDPSIVKIKPSGGSCRVSALHPGKTKLIAKVGKHRVGYVAITVPDNCKLPEGLYQTLKEEIKIDGAGVVNSCSPLVTYKVSLKQGQYLSTNGSEGAKLGLVTDWEDSIFTTSGKCTGYSFLYALSPGREWVQLEINGTTYPLEVDVLPGTVDDTLQKYENWVRSFARESNLASLSQYDLVKTVSLRLSAMDYSLTQDSKYTLAIKGVGNCVSSSELLIDVCKRYGIGASNIVVCFGYTDMYLSSAKQGRDHCITAVELDKCRSITDTTPRGFSAFSLFDYSKAEEGEWVFPKEYREDLETGL